MSTTQPPQPRCLNCPDKPIFPTKEALIDHWKMTHTVPMIITENDPWGERAPRTRKLVEGI